MPIKIYSGMPGNGKTALMMEELHADAAKAERPIFAAGIAGLSPGLATTLDDPRKWNEIVPDVAGDCDCDKGPPGHAHVVPTGAKVFVDEAWKWFGHLHDATRQATPAHVLALAEHRHRGIDFVWTIQMPNQVYPFSRGLIADHLHVVRRFGTKFIDVFAWPELNEDVKSAAKRENAQRTTRTLPTKVFNSYKSAEVHTIKAKLPLKVVLLPFLFVTGAVLLWYAYNSLRPENMAGTLTGATDAPPGAAAAPIGAAAASERQRPMTTVEYAAAHLPRFATMPHTMPIFDDRAPVTDPILVCASTDGGYTDQGEYRGSECQCQTEQGTRYDMSDGECRRVARWGQPYNPYRAPSRPVDDRERQHPESPQPATHAQAMGIDQAGRVNRYGQFRDEPQGPDKYEVSSW